MNNRIKVVLDTNVWISGLLWGGIPRQVIHLAEQKKIIIYTSLFLFQELEDTLTYPKLQSRIKLLELNINELLAKVRLNSHFVKPQKISLIPELRDFNDKIVLETSFSVPVDVIISGDLDLLVLKQFQGIDILTAANFLQRY